MSFIPEAELKESRSITLAPMIDFLFLMLAVFASLAFTRMITRDSEIELVKFTKNPNAFTSASEYKIINITVSKEGKYKWVTEIRDHLMETPQDIAQELLRQYQKGLLPEDRLKTQVLVKIDKNARWNSILPLLLEIKEAGFEVRPIYEEEDSKI